MSRQMNVTELQSGIFKILYMHILPLPFPNVILQIMYFHCQEYLGPETDVGFIKVTLSLQYIVMVLHMY
jgi:hypothetical protein